MVANSTRFSIVSGDGVGFGFVVLSNDVGCGFNLVPREYRG